MQMWEEGSGLPGHRGTHAQPHVPCGVRMSAISYQMREGSWHLHQNSHF